MTNSWSLSKTPEYRWARLHPVSVNSPQPSSRRACNPRLCRTPSQHNVWHANFGSEFPKSGGQSQRTIEAMLLWIGFRVSHWKRVGLDWDGSLRLGWLSNCENSSDECGKSVHQRPGAWKPGHPHHCGWKIIMDCHCMLLHRISSLISHFGCNIHKNGHSSTPTQNYTAKIQRLYLLFRQGLYLYTKTSLHATF